MERGQGNLDPPVSEPVARGRQHLQRREPTEAAREHRRGPSNSDVLSSYSTPSVLFSRPHVGFDAEKLSTGIETEGRRNSV